MQVAERTLLIWNNEYFIELVSQYRKDIFPMLIESLEENAAGHWNSAVHQLTLNVMKLLQVWTCPCMMLTLHNQAACDVFSTLAVPQRFCCHYRIWMTICTNSVVSSSLQSERRRRQRSNSVPRNGQLLRGRQINAGSKLQQCMLDLCDLMHTFDFHVCTVIYYNLF